MNAFLSSVIPYVLIFLPPIISGPIPAVVFAIIVVKAKLRWPLLVFWALMLAISLAAFATMACSFGHAFPGAGFFAFLLTPIAAIISLAILLMSTKAVRRRLGNNRQQQISHIVGIVGIPLLQLLMAAAFPLIRESLAYWMSRLGFRC